VAIATPWWHPKASLSGARRASPGYDRCEGRGLACRRSRHWPRARANMPSAT